MKKYYKGLKRLSVFLFAIFLSSYIMAQRTVSGVITDDEGVTLIGASVLVEGTTVGTVTDVDGSFSINVPDGSDFLLFSYTGYGQQRIDISGKDLVNISMISSEIIDEVVVVGYGRQKKSLVSGAISSVKVDEIKSFSSPQLQSALQGRTAGVTILPTSGSPGAGFKVRVRGTGSNGNSEPLYIVDGMRTGDISFLTPDEIESIEVLKDAASAAIYGANGANGVVIVTTKRGDANNAGVTYDFQYGNQWYNGNLELMNAEQHAIYMEEAGLGRLASDAAGVTGTDWLSEVFETAPLARHTLSFNGGNNKLNYYLQGSYFNQDGIIAGDNDRFQRYSARANVNNEVNDWLSVGASVNYANSRRQGVSENSEFGGILSNAILMDPLTPVAYETGQEDDFVQGLLDAGNSLLRNEDGQIYGLSEFVNGEIVNPLAALQLTNGRGFIGDRIFGSAFAKAKIYNGLSVTSRIGIDNTSGYYQGWTPSYYFTQTSQANNSSVNQGGFRNGSWQWENFANYDLELGSSNLNFVLGNSLYEFTNAYVNAGANGLTVESDIFGFIDATSPAVENRFSSGGESKNSLASFFGRVSYDYAGKYIINGTLRRDGSSLLADGNQWGTFPSVSAGWVISRENFFNQNGILNFAKLRASWGQNGSLANIGQGAWRSAIGFGGVYPNALGQFQTTASPTILSNPELTWETSEQLDLGIDLGFFDDRLTVTADWFNKTTKDLLNGGIIPNLVGNNAPVVNLGSIRNRGVELEVNHRNKIGKLGFQVGGNLTFLRNEVTELDENLDFAGGTGVGVGWTATAFQEGLPAWHFRGYETDGILADEAATNAYAEELGFFDADGNRTVQPGDPRIVDTNGDGVITPDDQTFIGSPHPDMIYGARLSLDYGMLDFTFFLQGTQGNDILLGYNRTDRATTNKPLFFFEDRWTPDNTDATFFRANGSNALAYNSDLMIVDGSYARVKQIQLGLNFTKDQLKFTRGGRIYISLDDIMTFTSYQGLDPEAGSTDDRSLGIDRGVYPIPARALIGVTLSL